MINLEERLLYLEAELAWLRTEIDLVKRRLATPVQVAPPPRCACTLPVFTYGVCSMCAGRL